MKPKNINCKTCGKQFVARDPRRMYCSALCNSKAQRLKKRAVWYHKHECKQCGIEFMPFTNRNVFCSYKCKYDYNNAKKAYPHTCVGCGKNFVSRDPDTKYCSRSCGLTHTRVHKVLTCIDCGVEFKFTGRTNKKRCKKCNKIYWNAYYADSMASRGTTSWIYSSAYKRKRKSLSAVHRSGYRAIAFNAWGDACIMCGAETIKHKPVDVHHVDGDLANINVTNLIPICRRCHCRVHKLARKLAVLNTPTKDNLIDALFKLWPKGQQVIGIATQRRVEDYAANSGKAKL